EKLRDGNSTEHTTAHVHQSCPGPGVFSSKLVPGLLHGRFAWKSECTCDMCTELDANADTNDKVDERDGVERHMSHGHDANHVNDNHDDSKGDHCSREWRSQKE